MIPPANDLPAGHDFTCFKTGRLSVPRFPKNGATPRLDLPTLPLPSAKVARRPCDAGQPAALAQRGPFEKKGP
jgi:hypothetical protein